VPLLERDPDFAKAFDALIEAWTGDRLDPEHRVETAEILRARRDIVDALCDSPEPIVILGPSGHGKTLLLRSLWRRPPAGFAPILAPCAGARPDQIAERILSVSRSGRVADAAAADAAAGFIRMLRTQAIRGARPVLLVDDLHEASPAAISELAAMAEASRVEVRWLAAGREGPWLDAVVDALPGPVRVETIDNPWSRADAERLIAQMTDALPEAAERLESIDLDDLLWRSDGNPRQLLASLATRLRERELPRLRRETFMTAPEAAASIERASSEPPREISEPPPPPVMRPVRASGAPPIALPPPPRRRPRRRRRGIPAGARSALIGVLAASVVIALLVDRGVAIAQWSHSAAATITAATSEVTGDAARWISTWQLPDVARVPAAAAERASAIAAATAERGSAYLRALLAALPRESDPEPEPIAPVAAAPPSPGAAAAVAAIPVGVNSDPWSNVEVDGAPAGSTPLLIELAPGPHRFRAAMADGRVIEKDLIVSERQNQIVFD